MIEDRDADRMKSALLQKASLVCLFFVGLLYPLTVPKELTKSLKSLLGRTQNRGSF
jgi:hypothetical protein